MSKIRWSCVAVMLLAATTPTFAQEAEAPEPSTEAAAEDSTAVDSPDAADEPSIPTYLDEVTVAATGTERSLGETPGKVDVIQAEEIERRGLNGFDDLVRYLPGVELDGDLGRFGTSGFRIRGIGGNRVLTRVDGVPNAEQFDFGPFTVTQLALDVDALESVEVVRSAGSALYGSDALGGVVDLTTRDPRSYLNGESRALALRGGYDGRSDELSEAIVFALGSDAWRASVLYSRRDGDELDNQGTNGAENSSRTEPNPIDRSSNQVLAKLGYSQSETSDFVVSAEWFDSDAETEVFSSRSSGSPFASAILDSDGTDTQERWRLSLEQTWVRETVAFDSLLARLYVQDAETEQVTLERRLPFQGESIRDGLLSFDQQTFGLDLDFYRSLGRGDELGVLTYGVDWQEDSFDQLRDRTEFVIATGEPVPTTLALPTKYFPESDIEELGLFVQAQLALFDGRLEVVPGVRYDEYSLDADQNDAIFLSGNPGSPPPVDLDTDSVSPKLGVVFQATDTFSVFGQYARGFRAPPMSAVNNGFTNFGGGYRTLASPDLEPETSDNLEFGVRGNFSRFDFSVTYFDNEYED
ncbi:MAG: TonB-dependent receptor, partial [Acidobacteriota bacterium]